MELDDSFTPRSITLKALNIGACDEIRFSKRTISDTLLIEPINSAGMPIAQIEISAEMLIDWLYDND